MKRSEDVIVAVVYFLLGLHSYCLIIFTFGWILLGIQTIEKGIKRCVTLGSFKHSFGDIQALVWVLSTSRWRQYSILKRFRT